MQNWCCFNLLTLSQIIKAKPASPFRAVARKKASPRQCTWQNYDGSNVLEKNMTEQCPRKNYNWAYKKLPEEISIKTNNALGNVHKKKNYGWGNFHGSMLFLGIEGVYGDLKQQKRKPIFGESTSFCLLLPAAYSTDSLTALLFVLKLGMSSLNSVETSSPVCWYALNRILKNTSKLKQKHLLVLPKNS